eukprot:jgi/Mesvir1/11140/Mv04582-RA.1
MADAFAKSINLAKWESICQLAEGGAMWRFLKNSCREGVDYRHSDPSASVWDAVDDPNLPNFRVPDVERRNVLITPRCVSDFLARRWNWDEAIDENEASPNLAKDEKRLGYLEWAFVRAAMRDLCETVAALRDQVEVLTNRVDALESEPAVAGQNMSRRSPFASRLGHGARRGPSRSRPFGAGGDPPPPLAPVQAPVVASGTQAAEAAAPKPTTATVLPVPKPAKPLPPVVPWKECDGTPYSSTPVLSSFAMTAGEDVTLDEFKQRKLQLQCAMAVVDDKCDRGKYAGMLVGGIHYDGKATVAHGSDGSITVLAPKTLKEPVKVWTKHTANFGSLKCIDDARRYLEELKKQGTISSFEISPEMKTTSGVITVKFRYAFVTTSKAVKDEQLKCYIFKTSSAKVTK